MNNSPLHGVFDFLILALGLNKSRDMNIIEVEAVELEDIIQAPQAPTVPPGGLGIFPLPPTNPGYNPDAPSLLPPVNPGFPGYVPPATPYRPPGSPLDGSEIPQDVLDALAGR